MATDTLTVKIDMPPPRRLVDRLRDAALLIEVLDKADLEPFAAGAGAAPISRVLSTADGRYRRVTADMVLGDDSIPDTAWKFTLDQETGLLWTDVLGDRDSGQNWDRSLEIASAFSHATGDRVGVFEAPTIQQQLSIIDYDRYDPAVDTRYFRGPYGYHWTRTRGVKKDGSPSGSAWAVSLGDGNSSRLHQSLRNHVRAVCPSQSLGLR